VIHVLLNGSSVPCTSEFVSSIDVVSTTVATPA